MPFLDLTVTNAEYFILVFARIISIISLLPIFGSRNIPVRIKAGLALMLSLLIFPMVNVSHFPDKFSIPSFVLDIIKEVYIGLVIGFCSTFLFAAVQFGGRLIDRQMGFMLVQLIDPFGEDRISVSGQFQVILYTIIFLSINGHYFLLMAIEKSFELIPLCGARFPSSNIAQYFIAMIADIFKLAISLAAPVFLTLVLTTVSLAIIARTVPQINIFFVGLPLKIGIGLILMIIVLPILANIFRELVVKLTEDMWRLLYMMA